jgi:hypothetical protein
MRPSDDHQQTQPEASSIRSYFNMKMNELEQVTIDREGLKRLTHHISL